MHFLKLLFYDAAVIVSESLVGLGGFIYVCHAGLSVLSEISRAFIVTIYNSTTRTMLPLKLN